VDCNNHGAGGYLLIVLTLGKEQGIEIDRGWVGKRRKSGIRGDIVRSGPANGWLGQQQLSLGVMCYMFLFFAFSCVELYMQNLAK